MRILGSLFQTGLEGFPSRFWLVTILKAWTSWEEAWVLAVKLTTCHIYNLGKITKVPGDSVSSFIQSRSSCALERYSKLQIDGNERNCLHQVHSLIQPKYMANYSNFPPVKEENKRGGQELGNSCTGGWILDRVYRASLSEKSTFE